MLVTIRASLISRFDPKLVDELLHAYVEAKRNYYLGGLRLSAVEGGRFSEAAFRMLQQHTTGSYTSLGNQIDTEGIIRNLSNQPSSAFPDSIRLHIPRSLRVVYDIRNKRDTAHLADGIDPNLQDATFVVSVLDWILAEFLRLFHSVSADEAHKLVEELVKRRAPAIEDFNGFLKVLNPNLSSGDHLLLLLYQCGSNGATYEELKAWSKPSMRANLARTLNRLVINRAYLHSPDDFRFYITQAGMREVEKNRLFEL